MLLKIWRENKIIILVLVASFVAVVASSAAFFTTGGDNLLLFIILGVFIVNFVFWLRAFAKILQKYISISAKVKKSKAWKALGRAFGFIFDGLAKIANAIQEKSRSVFEKILLNRRGPLLRGYSDERTFVFGGKNSVGSKLRKMKWRSLNNNRERIRYIYITFLKKQIKAGANVRLSDTPNELYTKLHEKNSGLDNTLFSLYNVARYNNNESSITAEDVNRVRKV